MATKNLKKGARVYIIKPMDGDGGVLIREMIIQSAGPKKIKAHPPLQETRVSEYDTVYVNTGFENTNAPVTMVPWSSVNVDEVKAMAQAMAEEIVVRRLAYLDKILDVANISDWEREYHGKRRHDVKPIVKFA